MSIDLRKALRDAEIQQKNRNFIEKRSRQRNQHKIKNYKKRRK